MYYQVYYNEHENGQVKDARFLVLSCEEDLTSATTKHAIRKHLQKPKAIITILRKKIIDKETYEYLRGKTPPPSNSSSVLSQN